MRQARRQKLQRIQKVTKRKLVEVADRESWDKLMAAAGERLILMIFTTRMGARGTPVMMIQDIAAQATYKHVIFAQVDMDACKFALQEAQVDAPNSVRYRMGGQWLPGNPKTPEQVVQLLSQYAATAPRPSSGGNAALTLALVAAAVAGGAAFFLTRGKGGKGKKGATVATTAPIAASAGASISSSSKAGSKPKAGATGTGSTSSGKGTKSGGKAAMAAPAPPPPKVEEDDDDDDDLDFSDDEDDE